MTREELKAATNDELIDELNYCGYDSYYRDYRDDVVAEIKKRIQEPVLDKIRAEIMDFEEELFHRPNTDYSDYSAVRHCVEIIDKYKAESEDKK